jgi:hypothetical protein
MSILQKIKNGKRNYKLVDFPGTNEKVAISILSSAEMTDCKVKSDKYIEELNVKDDDFKDIILQQYVVYNCLRDKDDTNKKLAESIEEIRNLDNVELIYLMSQYNLLVQETSPFLASVTEEQFEMLKKTLEKMNWKDLSGESLLSLRNFLMSLT